MIQTVTEYLAADHDRLDAILAEVEEMVRDGEIERADHTFGPFNEGLRRHIRIEEEILFPMFEQRFGAGHGPTAVMRSEHRSIEQALDLMRDALERQKGDLFYEAYELITQTLPDHNTKEERVLYPTLDKILDEKTRAAAISRMDAVLHAA